MSEGPPTAPRSSLSRRAGLPLALSALEEALLLQPVPERRQHELHILRLRVVALQLHAWRRVRQPVQGHLPQHTYQRGRTAMQPAGAPLHGGPSAEGIRPHAIWMMTMMVMKISSKVIPRSGACPIPGTAQPLHAPEGLHGEGARAEERGEIAHHDAHAPDLAHGGPQAARQLHAVHVHRILHHRCPVHALGHLRGSCLPLRSVHVGCICVSARTQPLTAGSLRSAAAITTYEPGACACAVSASANRMAQHARASTRSGCALRGKKHGQHSSPRWAEGTEQGG